MQNLAEITVHIQIPGLIEAINSLKDAISCAGTVTMAPVSYKEPANTPLPFAEIPQAPVQVSIPQAAPVQLAPAQLVESYGGSPAQMWAPPAQVMPGYPTTPEQREQIINQALVQQQAPMPQTQPVAAVPVAAQTYTQDQLAVAATQILDSGRQQDLLNLLAAFGVPALTALPKEQYGAFATQLRAMGAKI